MVDLSSVDVCFLALTLGQGGAERQLYYMLRTLVEAGAQPRVLCLTKDEIWEQKIQDLGVPVLWVGQSQFRIGRLLCMVRTLRNQPPDVLHSAHFFMNIYATAAARLLNAREIGAIRSDGVTNIYAAGAWFARGSLILPRVIAANSSLAVRNVVESGVSRQRLYLLPNVVDADHFAPKNRTRSSTTRIVAVGRLTEPKRFDRFLIMLDKLQQSTQCPITATLVGDGPLRAQLEQQAQALGLLPETLVFTGEVLDPADYYRHADIFVLTSDWEGTPNVLLEAMASGLPVVATNVGGVSDVVTDGNTGFLVATDDVEMMVDRLHRLIENSDLRHMMGKLAREHIAEHYSLDRLPVFLSKLYSNVLNNK